MAVKDKVICMKTLKAQGDFGDDRLLTLDMMTFGQCDIVRGMVDLGWWYEDVMTAYVKVRIPLSSPGGMGGNASKDVDVW